MLEPLIAVIRVMKDEPPGAITSKIQAWLTREGIEPSQFKTKEDVWGHTVTVGFHNLEEADRFRAEFEARDESVTV
jgi:hypothetical protein